MYVIYAEIFYILVIYLIPTQPQSPKPEIVCISLKPQTALLKNPYL